MITCLRGDGCVVSCYQWLRSNARGMLQLSEALKLEGGKRQCETEPLVVSHVGYYGNQLSRIENAFKVCPRTATNSAEGMVPY